MATRLPVGVAASAVRWATIAAIVAALITLGLHASTLSGYFLSDDIAILGDMFQAANTTGLFARWSDIAAHGLPDLGGFYRPISFGSLALDFWIGGAQPLSWRLTSLILHLLCGALMYRLARRLTADQPLSVPIALMAAALFWLWPLVPEVSVWAIARNDSLVALGMLLAFERQLASRRCFDSAQIVSLLALAFAFGSKESAMLAPPLMLLLKVAQSSPDIPWLRRVGLALRHCLPALALLGVYLGWRQILFGQVLQVYAGTAPTSHLQLWELVQRFAAMAPVLAPLRSAAWMIGAVSVVSLLFSARMAWRRGVFLRLWLTPAIALAICIGALLPHFSSMPTNGEGGRLFYLPGAWLVLWLTLPWSASEHPRSVVAGLAALSFLFALGQAQAMVPWRKAGSAMNTLIAAIGRTAAELRVAHAHGMLLVSDHWHSAPFARNATGGIAMRPSQPSDLLDTIVPFTVSGYADWSRALTTVGGMPWPGFVAGDPVHWYCFDAGQTDLVELSIAAPPSPPGPWQEAWQQALAASPCRDQIDQ